MTSTKEYFEYDTYVDPTVAPNGTLAVLQHDRGSSQCIVVNLDYERTSEQIVSVEDRMRSYDWVNEDTIWYTVWGDPSIRYLDMVAVLDGESVGESIRERQIEDDHDVVFDILPGPEHDQFAVSVREGLTYSTRIYSAGDLTEPVEQFPMYNNHRLLTWRPDGECVLVKEINDSFSHRLVALDLANGKKQVVTDEIKDARYVTPGWDPEGRNLYLVTDYEADRLYAARLSPDDRTLTPVVERTDHTVESIGVHDSGRLMYSVNHDGISTVYVGELKGDKEVEAQPLTDLPSGVATHAAFGPEGNRLVLTVSTETVPSAVYVCDIDTRTVSRWLSSPSPSNTFMDTPDERLSRVIRYTSDDSREIPALFTRPPVGTDLRGAVVDVHGGPENQRRPRYRPHLHWFIERGYAVLEPNIRGSTGYGRQYANLDEGPRRIDAADDVATGGEWLRSQVETDHVVVSGTSHGGLLALVNAYRSPEVFDAAISTAGIYDLEKFVQSLEIENRELRVAKYGNPSKNQELFDTLSPLRHADEVDIPVLVVHGEDDRTVLADGARQFVESVAASGEHAEVLLFEDEGHSIESLESIRTKYERLASFLGTVL
ncbi:S9 family peptidase [Natrinema salsiterrestre]|uniref:Prolyl oligopeptidase family serine peptidase n=1 Tax=Natrinema salsiterrestre TaxID=2950540 RepID=A0A9Q4L0B5_9EURY|nr:prolyl oligopeptidase family serine peptidase [Natrinema salsiterrestre]MDF9747473.1 prolyl oligopeptidase family serine peptidase [Natrinema salsiterrestre]